MNAAVFHMGQQPGSGLNLDRLGLESQVAGVGGRRGVRRVGLVHLASGERRPANHDRIRSHVQIMPGKADVGKELDLGTPDQLVQDSADRPVAAGRRKDLPDVQVGIENQRSVDLQHILADPETDGERFGRWENRQIIVVVPIEDGDETSRWIALELQVVSQEGRIDDYIVGVAVIDQEFAQQELHEMAQNTG